MIGCVDVQYKENRAYAALILFDDWLSETITSFRIERMAPVADYVPGRFYKRELPCILSAIKSAPAEPEFLLIDGYVWLEENMPGLGAHLFDALQKRVVVVGIAKSQFKNGIGIELLRGGSARPLFITSAGIEPQLAASYIQHMHGAYRLPTMVKLADSYARQAALDDVR